LPGKTTNRRGLLCKNGANERTGKLANTRAKPSTKREVCKFDRKIWGKTLSESLGIMA